MNKKCHLHYRYLLSFIILLLWLSSLWLQHETVIHHHEQTKSHSSFLLKPSISKSILTRNSSTSRTSTTTTTTTTNTNTFEQIQPPNHLPSSLQEPSTMVEGTLNGIPVTFHSKKNPLYSQIQCTNVNHWKFRSCHYTNLCYDLIQHDFVLLSSMKDEAEDLLTLYKQQKNQSSVSIGGINPRWDVPSSDTNQANNNNNNNNMMKGSDKMEWFPRIVKGDVDVYQLPDNVVLVPFHSMAAHNVGHMLWDDLYPIYRLLQTWNFIQTKKKKSQYLLLRHKLPDHDVLYATCDIRRNKRMGCKKNFDTFLQPIMGVNPTTFSTTQTVQFNVSVNRTSSPTMVCATNGVAGIGILTDHGLADHGWDFNTIDNRVPHNIGHARDFWDFGQWALQNALGYDFVQQQQQSQKQVLKIVFSLDSSKDWDRRLDFLPYREALQKSLEGNVHVQMEAYRFWELSVEQQLQLTASTSILIATCGGGGVLPVTFLPRGSVMIVFYNPNGGYDYSSGQKRFDWPARLDWDLLQHAAAHVRVHWFPIHVANNQLSPVSADDIQLFVKLIHHELKSMNS